MVGSLCYKPDHMNSNVCDFKKEQLVTFLHNALKQQQKNCPAATLALKR